MTRSTRGPSSWLRSRTAHPAAAVAVLGLLSLGAAGPSAPSGGLVLAAHVDAPGPYAVGDVVSYTYTVTNTGGARVASVKVTDDTVGGIVCTAAVLAPGAGTECHGSHLVGDADLQAGVVTNQAQASGTSEGDPLSSVPVEGSVTVAGEPDLHIAKADLAGSGDLVAYTVTNTGGTRLTNVAVTDYLAGTVSCAPSTLKPGRHATCRIGFTVTAAGRQAGHLSDTAHATAVDPHGNGVRSTDTQATVTVAPCPPPESPHPERSGCTDQSGRPGTASTGASGHSEGLGVSAGGLIVVGAALLVSSRRQREN